MTTDTKLDRKLCERLLSDVSDDDTMELAHQLGAALVEIDRLTAPAQGDPAKRAEELAAEHERHVAAMTPGALFVVVRGTTPETVELYVDAEGQPDDCAIAATCRHHARQNADGFRYLRNAAPEVAAVLRGLVAEVEAMRAVCEAAERVTARGEPPSSPALADLHDVVDTLRAQRGNP